MISAEDIRLEKLVYRNVYLVNDRASWKNLKSSSNKEHDLVLCIDFGLKQALQNDGFSVQFLDHLVHNRVLAVLNIDTHKFLYHWYKDTSGKDNLEYNGIGLGDAMLLNVLNDVTYFCHLFFNLYALKTLEFQSIMVSSKDQVLLQVLDILGFEYKLDTYELSEDWLVYSFPISKWMDEAINRKTIRKKIKNVLSSSFDIFGLVWDYFTIKKRKRIYIQSYHPTVKIIERLLGDKDKRLILPDFSFFHGVSRLIRQRRISYRSATVSKTEIQEVLQQYIQGEKFQWVYEGIDLSTILYKIVDEVVKENISEAILKAKVVSKYFNKYPLDLAIPVTDLWLENRIVMNYCRNNDIPTFFIANGLLNNPLMNEGKDSNFVNCHSLACKEDYFFNAQNVYPLGDPRMDEYAEVEPKNVNRELPTIIIGAAGYDVTDLNSYLAFEFDFLFDILTSIYSLQVLGYQSKIVLKVRANGYSSLYDSFTKEYFPSLKVEIIQNTPFIEVVKRADLYISFYSQTIFEAASLGIPVIYYKKDTQTIFRPFDGKGDLVTATDDHTLIEKIELFYAGDSVFESFQKKANLEKFVGPLDGNNLKRNLDFINGLL